MSTECQFTSRQTGRRFQTAITDYQAAGLDGKAVVRQADRRMTGDGRCRRSGQLRRLTQISLERSSLHLELGLREILEFFVYSPLKHGQGVALQPSPSIMDMRQ